MPDEQVEQGEWAHVGDEVRTNYSAITTHRRCPMQFYYRYVLRVGEPDDGPAPERDFGSWWSAWRAAESLERGRALDTLRAEPRLLQTLENGPEFDMRTVTVDDVEEAAGHWWRERSSDVKDAWVEKLGEDLPTRLRAVGEAWEAEWREQIAQEEPLGVEVQWRRALPRPADDARWQSPLGMPSIALFGTIDEVFFDRRRGLVVVRDQKTSKQLATRTAVDDMMDSQLHLYAWGAAALIASWERGPVRAVAYDRARSVKPTSPQLTLMGALSKSVTMYDLRTYLDWVGDGIPWGEEGATYASGPRKGQPKFGTYVAEETVIERLRTPASRSQWFQRSVDPLSLALVRSHLRAAVDTATDIWRTQQRVAITHEAGRNLNRQTCGWCEYAHLCRAQMIGGADGTYELAEFGLYPRDSLQPMTLDAGALVPMEAESRAGVLLDL